MAGGKSNYLKSQELNYFMNATAGISKPTAWYVALFTDATGASSQPTSEATTANCPGYARQSVAFGTSSGGSSISNSGSVTFTASGTWVTVNYIAIFDAATNGNMLYWGPLSASKTLNNTDQLQFAAGQITVGES